MSGQPEEKSQGVEVFSVFRFPEKLEDSDKPSVQKASWASLASGKKRLKLDRQAVIPKPFARAAFPSASFEGEPVTGKAEKAFADDGDVPEKIADSPVEPENEIAASGPESDLVDSAAVQKVLDEMYQKGLEQGRQEGRAEQLAAAQQEACQQGFAQGRSQGVEQGIQQGLEQAGQKLQATYSTLERLADELSAQKKILGDRQIAIAARLLERLLLEILRVELQHSPESIEAVVRESLTLLDADEQENLRVYLHTDDLARVTVPAGSAQLNIRLVEDDQLVPGGCRIEGALGDVDATLETRLSAAIEHIRSLLLDDQCSDNPDVAEVVDEFVVSTRQSRSGAGVKVPAVKHPPAVSGGIEPAAAIPSFSFDPDSSSELGAWDSLGQ